MHATACFHEQQQQQEKNILKIKSSDTWCVQAKHTICSDREKANKANERCIWTRCAGLLYNSDK